MARTVRTSVVRGFRIAAVGIVLLASSAHGQVDMSGPWRVKIDAPFGCTGSGCYSAIWSVTQSGVDLSAQVPIVPTLVETWTGTIDPLTGSFTLEGPTPEPGMCRNGATGVVNPTSTSFSGSFLNRSFRCMEVAFPLEGRRCGNGVLEPGEQCEDGNFDDGDCCSSTCQLDPSGTSCGALNSCTVDSCDGAGTCVIGGPADGRPCDDDTFCNGADTCQGGTCSVHAGDPCVGLGDCHACDEFTHQCRTPPGFPCSDDGQECTVDQCDTNMVCQHLPAGAGVPCTQDSNPCTLDQCDGAGACAHPPSPSPFPCSDDGKGCTSDMCDGAGSCQHAPRPSGTRCGDCGRFCNGVSGDCPTIGSVPAGARGDCTFCDVCDAQGRCVTAPISSCKRPLAAAASRLWVDVTQPESPRLLWKWAHGQATSMAEFGSPDTVDDYGMCIYEAAMSAPHRIGIARLTAGDNCPAPPCWRRGVTALRYRSSLGLPFTSVRMRSGIDGRASIKMTAKSIPLLLDLSGLTGPAATPILVQLQSENGSCWEATYSSPTRNDGVKLNARSD